MKIISRFAICLLLTFFGLSAPKPAMDTRKSECLGNKQPRLGSGAVNFQPSTAINQLEMFQAATFDPATIDKELGWAEGLGLNAMRVYLHHIAWTTDKAGFKKRLDQYLQIADKHGIKTIMVFF